MQEMLAGLQDSVWRVLQDLNKKDGVGIMKMGAHSHFLSMLPLSKGLLKSMIIFLLLLLLVLPQGVRWARGRASMMHSSCRFLRRILLMKAHRRVRRKCLF